MSLVDEYQLQPERSIHEQAPNEHRRSFFIPWDTTSSKENSQVELLSFETAWSGSKQYPERSWN